jgi:hypothetical protein
MNERIKELAEQSAISCGYFIGPRLYMTHEKEMEKFAELLVKECMTVARGADGLDATHEAWYLIKQHFGVEE